MKKLSSYFLLLYSFSFLYAQKLMEDVTGDKVDDEIIWGKNSVVVVDGATGKREVIFKVQSFGDTSGEIEDVITIPLGDKVGIKIIELPPAELVPATAESGRLPHVFLYRNGKWIEIDDPGNKTDIYIPEFGYIYYKDQIIPDIDFGISVGEYIIRPFYKPVPSLLYWDGSKFKKLETRFHKGDYNLKIGTKSSIETFYVVDENDILVLYIYLLNDVNTRAKIYDSKGYVYYDGMLSGGRQYWLIKGSRDENGEGSRPLIVYVSFDNRASSPSHVWYEGFIFTTKKDK
ncbi:MAG: hypothetical protein ABIL52_03260 [candidate division WOR-3 bacterium]